MNNWAIDWRELFLSANGRLARTPFLFGAGVLIGALFLYENMFGVVAHWASGWAVYPAALYTGACVLSKRLHDRGKSGWWSALILFAMGVAWPHPRGLFDLVFVLVVIWAVIELAVLPGEQGTNRFGANPMKPAPGFI